MSISDKLNEVYSQREVAKKMLSARAIFDNLNKVVGESIVELQKLNTDRILDLMDPEVKQMVLNLWTGLGALQTCFDEPDAKIFLEWKPPEE